MTNTVQINCENRFYSHKDKDFIGVSNENEVEKLRIELDEEKIVEDTIPYLEIGFPDDTKKIIQMNRISNTISEIEIKNSLLKQEGCLKLQFVLISNNIKVFKSEIFELKVLEAINATETLEEDYPNVFQDIEEMKKDIEKLKENGGADLTEILADINNLKVSEEQQNNNILTNSNKITLIETQSGSKINLSINTTDYVMTLELLNSNDEILSSKSIDFPLESMVVNGRFENNNIILTLQNGNEVSFSVASLVNGLINQETFNTFKDEINKKFTEIQNNEKINDPLLKRKTNIRKFFELEGGATHVDGWGGCYYYKIGTKVTVHIGVRLTSVVRTKIFTLPEGFRPPGTMPIWGGGADGAKPDQSFCEIFGNTLGADGEIYVKCPSKLGLFLVEYDVFESEKVTAINNESEANYIEINNTTKEE